MGRGMAGSAIASRFAREDYEIVTATQSELDLQRRADVESRMTGWNIDAVFLAAATVGGILANTTQPTKFLYENPVIETDIITYDAKGRR